MDMANISAILPKTPVKMGEPNSSSKKNGGGNSTRSFGGLMQQEADKMVKKENLNYLQPGRFIGDDEMDNLIQEEEDEP